MVGFLQQVLVGTKGKRPAVGSRMDDDGALVFESGCGTYEQGAIALFVLVIQVTECENETLPTSKARKQSIHIIARGPLTRRSVAPLPYQKGVANSIEANLVVDETDTLANVLIKRTRRME